jgi:DNA-binding NarL/FixJ family response regulator
MARETPEPESPESSFAPTAEEVDRFTRAVASERLTHAETEVVRAALTGATNSEVAAKRQTSLRTVANQLASAYRKLGVCSRSELAVRIAAAGLRHQGRRIAGVLRALTPRERAVARLVATGQSGKVIAYELGVAESTVSSILGSMRRKLGVRSRVELFSLLVLTEGAASDPARARPEAPRRRPRRPEPV